jgi:hypothetical protein
MPKEKWFWTNFMGTTDDHAAFAAAENALQAFVADPKRIGELRAEVAATVELPASEKRQRLLHGLHGWLNFFELNAIESADARAMDESLVQDDTALFAKRKTLALHYTNERAERTEASTLVLSTNLVSADDEGVRRSSHAALLELERWAVDNGFIDMLKRRNAFARAPSRRASSRRRCCSACPRTRRIHSASRCRSPRAWASPSSMRSSPAPSSKTRC